MDKPRRIELLAPARDYAGACCAVDYGADALYAGAASFGARRAAANSVEDIARMVQMAKPFGVRVYAAVNTLVLEDELEAARAQALELARAGVDALIVQDMAYLRMGIQGVEFHASTQTTNLTPGKVDFLSHCGFSRAILERGLTLDDIRRIHQAVPDIGLECFVHGAICVGYSGKCYLSRSMGPRSGNRGDCAQSCRMSYDLLDAAGNKVLSRKHLLSLMDLDLGDRLGDLLDAGVDSFKIEGRLKDDNYVKNTVARYRQLLDAQIAARRVSSVPSDPAASSDLTRSSRGISPPGFTPDATRSFSRGATPYYIDGPAAGAASMDTPKATGRYVGRVEALKPNGFLYSGEPLSPGDGICFLDNGELAGTGINVVEGPLVIPNSMAGITPGTELYRNFDYRFNAQLEADRTGRKIPLKVYATYRHSALALRFTDGKYEINQASEPGLAPAENREQTLATLREALSKSGGTIFEIAQVEVTNPEEALFIPISAVNALRRRALTRFAEMLGELPPGTPSDSLPGRDLRREDPSYPAPEDCADMAANTVNPLAAAFWRDHGMPVAPDSAPELAGDYKGRCVMTTPYCIRREIGQCLKEKPTLKGALTLRRGTMEYALEFDCENCIMKLVKL